MKNSLKFQFILSVAFLLAVFESSAESLKVDFNGSSAQTMSGYQAYTAQNEVAGSFGSRSYSAFGTSITITPTWTGSPATNTAQQAQVRSANGYSTNAADLPDLLLDWIGTDTRENPGDPMTLIISGLPAGSYGWLSYHHDTQDQQGVFSVTVNDAAGSATTSGVQISHTQGTSNTNLASVSKFATTITSDGVNPVSLMFDLTSSTNPVSTAFFVMNGFQITNGLVVAPPQTNAALRRPISPSQPMLLVHNDTWNAADPQKIIDLIPADIRPYVVMNISLSISHNNSTDPGRFNVVEYGYETAKSWVRTCAQNRMWVMIQPSSGGFSHLSDFDLSVYHEFFQSYPNFLGFNYTEQFWGFDLADDNPPDLLSAFWVDRINHFADLLQVCNQYGGYLVVSWCGNQWSPNINPIGMLKRIPAFEAACRKFTENFVLCDKFTQVSYQSDMQSLCLGAYVSGYAGNWGIRYDDTGWTDVSRTHTNFTMASAGAPYMDHVLMDGATVIDGPELIWTQDFRELSAGATDNGFTMRRWDRFPQFDNVTIDFFRKLIDGTVRIPTRQEVIDRAKVVIINNVNSGTSDDIYSSPPTLFEGLYRMDGDGNLRDNLTLHKKTGRYPTIPVVYALDDTLANSFQVKVNKSAYSTRWPGIAAKTNEFNALFPEEYTGDLCARRLENQWIVYNPFKVIGQTASANIPFKYNTCDSIDLTFSEYTAGVFTEVSNKVTFYLGNYDNFVNTALKTDTITINGATGEPTYSWTDRASHQASVVSKSWSGGVFTLTVQHNGPLDITINCAGSATGRLTAFTSPGLVVPTLPPAFPGQRQYEGECFDYKNVTAITKNGYSGIVRNYTGQGYVQIGTSSTAAVRDAVTVLSGGIYRVETKYSVTGANVGTVDLYVNGIKVATPFFTQTAGATWATNKQTITLNGGVNTIEFRANGTGASSIYFDNFVVVPVVITGGVIVQENQTGFISVDGAIENANSGYTGDGYAKTTNAIGVGINWNLNFDSSVIKSFTFRYAGTNSGTANLIIGGVNVASSIQFPATGSLTNWENVTVYAYTPAGNSAVRLQSASAVGLPNIDYLEVTGGWAGTQPPSGLIATALSKSVINLSWIAANNATSYTVKRALASGGPYGVVASGITSTNYTNTGLIADTTYYYVVSATAGMVEGSDSGEASVTTSSGAVTVVGSANGMYSVSSGSGVAVGTFDLDDRANALVVGVYIDASNISCLTNLTSFGGVPPSGFIQTSGAGDREFALYWINPKTAAGQALIIAANASANIGAGYFALQLSGVDTNAPVIKTGNTTASASTVNLATTAANSFIASFYSANDSGLTLTPASPLALISATLNNINGVSGGGSFAAATSVKATPGSQNLSWSSSGTIANQGVNGLAFAPFSPDGPPVGPAILTNSYNGGVLSLSWPAGEGWRLQMQTNSASAGLGTNWMYVTGSTVSSTNISINPTSETVFFRLVYP